MFGHSAYLLQQLIFCTILKSCSCGLLITWQQNHFPQVCHQLEAVNHFLTVHQLQCPPKRIILTSLHLHRNTHTDSPLLHHCSLFLFQRIFFFVLQLIVCLFLDSVPCGILVPPPGRPGIKSIPQQWKYRVLTTGLPGNSLFKTKVLREKLHDIGFGNDFSDVTL